jgi:hypothetical protein
MKKSILIFPILIFSLFGCKKELDYNSKSHPIIITKEVTDINSTGITLNAEVEDIGREDIADYGFILTTENAEYSYSIKNETAISQFTKRVTTLEENTEYTCRAYINTTKNMVYGNSVSFISQGAISSIYPRVEHYQPKEGYDHSTVIITGEYFNLYQGNKYITIRDIEGQIINWEDNRIEFITPVMEFTGDTKIAIHFDEIVIYLNYKVLGPELLSISKITGYTGDIK